MLVPQLNNFTFTFPSSPLLTQAEDVDPDLMCRKETLPLRCQGLPICECVHVIDLPLRATVELILVDQGNRQQMAVIQGPVKAKPLCIHSFQVNSQQYGNTAGD
jgi:hypothetical protein